MASPDIYSLEVERHTLSGLINHQEVFPDVDQFIDDDCFYSKVNRTIFCVFREKASKGEKVDNVILGAAIKNLGITFKDSLDIYDYLDSLALSQITKKATIESCKELVKYKVRRNILNSLKETARFVQSCGNMSIDEIISGCDEKYNNEIASLTMQDEPVDMFGELKGMVMERAQNPVSQIGLVTPYDYFNKLYGGLRAGNGLYAICSRPKHGKSTWLLEMAKGVYEKNNCPVLILDTEMDTEVNQFRAASSTTDIGMWHLESGMWSKNHELADRIKYLDELDKYKGKIWHMKVANVPIDRVLSIMRRWYYKHVGRNGKALMIYDYIKITGETLGRNQAEHQVIGEKINKLNETGGELGVPLFSAMQLNREAENERDDSAAIALSDRLQQYAALVAIFRRKRLAEIAEDGEEFGTHKFIPLATRFQGEFAAGHMDLVKVPIVKASKATKKSEGADDGVVIKREHVYKENYLNYLIKNFRISEKGSLQQIIDKKFNSGSTDDENRDEEKDVFHYQLTK
jgi:replicative DNA helicase